MNDIEREEVEDNLYTMMLYSEAADAITNSGVSAVDFFLADPSEIIIWQTQTLKQNKKHGTNAETDEKGKAYPKPGKMYAAGWHRTMGEQGIDVGWYSVCKPSGVKARRRAIEKWVGGN